LEETSPKRRGEEKLWELLEGWGMKTDLSFTPINTREKAIRSRTFLDEIGRRRGGMKRKGGGKQK